MSDWSKVTRPIPVPNEWTKPFWEAAKKGVLALQRCQSCGHFQHPPYATCVRCMAIDLKFEPVAGKGAIYAYTIMYHRDSGSPQPYLREPHVELAPRGALMAGNRRCALHRGEGDGAWNWFPAPTTILRAQFRLAATRRVRDIPPPRRFAPPLLDNEGKIVRSCHAPARNRSPPLTRRGGLAEAGWCGSVPQDS